MHIPLWSACWWRSNHTAKGYLYLLLLLHRAHGLNGSAQTRIHYLDGESQRRAKGVFGQERDTGMYFYGWDLPLNCLGLAHSLAQHSFEPPLQPTGILPIPVGHQVGLLHAWFPWNQGKERVLSHRFETLQVQLSKAQNKYISHFYYVGIEWSVCPVRNVCLSGFPRCLFLF